MPGYSSLVKINLARIFTCYLLSALVIVLALFLIPAQSIASSSVDLFKVEVLVPDESKNIRYAAFTKGLQQVVVRLSGDGDILNKMKLPPASRLLKQYRYHSVEQNAASARKSKLNQLQLLMQFDAEKVETLLRENNIPIWSARRDKLVMWLAVRDGMQQYLLRNSDSSQIKSAADAAAAERGLPLVWPAFDSKDRQAVLFADVWAGFSEPLLQASTRYARGAVLAGNLAWNGSAWDSEWSLIDSNNNQRWAFSNANYSTVISMALNRIADNLGRRYAVLDTRLASDSVRVELKGVSSVQQFQYAQKLLASSPSVKQAILNTVRQDAVIFDLVLRTDRQDFEQRMNRSPELRPLLVSDYTTDSQATITSTDQAADAQARVSPAGVQAQIGRLDQPDYRYQLSPSR